MVAICSVKRPGMIELRAAIKCCNGSLKTSPAPCCRSGAWKQCRGFDTTENTLSPIKIALHPTVLYTSLLSDAITALVSMTLSAPLGLLSPAGARSKWHRLGPALDILCRSLHRDEGILDHRNEPPVHFVFVTLHALSS